MNRSTKLYKVSYTEQGKELESLYDGKLVFVLAVSEEEARNNAINGLNYSGIKDVEIL